MLSNLIYFTLFILNLTDDSVQGNQAYQTDKTKTTHAPE